MVRVFEGSMGEWWTQVHILSGDLGGFLQRVAFKMHLEGESSHPQIKVEGHFQWGAGGVAESSLQFCLNVKLYIHSWGSSMS